jgi:hypothetical protein
MTRYGVQIEHDDGHTVAATVVGPTPRATGPRGWHGAPGAVARYARAWAVTVGAHRWRVTCTDAATVAAAGVQTLAAGLIPGGVE